MFVALKNRLATINIIVNLFTAVAIVCGVIHHW